MCRRGNFLILFYLMKIHSLVEYSKKWESLGLKTSIINVVAQIGSKKIINKSVKITDQIKNDGYNLQDDFNFIGILLKGSDLICLDIDPVIPESISNFYLFLHENSADPDKFLMERSLNGGLHVYFRLSGKIINEFHFGEFSGIYLDVLTNSRVFTSPSSFKNKKYEWIGMDIHQINSIEEIPEIPEFLFDSIKKCNIYKK